MCFAQGNNRAPREWVEPPTSGSGGLICSKKAKIQACSLDSDQAEHIGKFDGYFT